MPNTPKSVILPRAEAGKGSSAPIGGAGALIFWSGVALTAIGLLDIGFAWAFPRLDEVAWRADTIRTTIDGLPLATIGMIALLAASIEGRRLRGLAVTAVGAAVVVLLLIALAALYFLAVRQLRGAQDPLAPAAAEMARTLGFAGIYLLLYAFISGTAFRRLMALTG